MVGDFPEHGRLNYIMTLIVGFFSDETINYIPLIGGSFGVMKSFLITKRVVMINVLFFHFQTYK